MKNLTTNSEQIKQLRSDVESLKTKLRELESKAVVSQAPRIEESMDIHEVNACGFCGYDEDEKSCSHNELYAIFQFPGGIYRGRCKKHFDQAIIHNFSLERYITVYRYPLVD